MSLRAAILAALLVALAACAPREVILEGPREELRSDLGAPADATGILDAGLDRAVPFSPPPPSTNSVWTHRAATPSHNMGHAALSDRPTEIWSTEIGEGNGRKHRITSDPVVGGGRVFTLDSRARVTAFSTGGTPLWSSNLTPGTDSADDASGGGLALGPDRLFVTTGFGRLHALDPTTGAELWVQRLPDAAAGAPTVFDGIVYAVTRDSTSWAIDAANGRVLWRIDGLPSISGFDGGASPAVNDRIVVFPTASGELVGALRQGGLRLWTASLSGGRLGRVYAQIRDVSGDPVLQGNRIFAGNPSGRTRAFDARTGETLWTAPHGSLSPALAVGGSVFVVSDENALVRLDAETGAEIWRTDLPFFVDERARRRKGVFAQYGPVLAGGRLIVASSGGVIRFFDPATGGQIGAQSVGGGAASNPVVANGTLYIVSASGRLHAFR
ncbi:MAG: PQQ-binding-like beta-propeller repeat protein [Pseudomonadota bacterium]